MCPPGALGIATRKPCQERRSCRIAGMSPHPSHRKLEIVTDVPDSAMVIFAHPHDGELEDTREFLGNIVHVIRRYRPHTVFVHDPYRMNGFQHRDHRKAGIATTDAVYPFE